MSSATSFKRVDRPKHAGPYTTCQAKYLFYNSVNRLVCLLKSAVSSERCAELSHVPAWLDHEMHYFKEPYQNLSFIVLRCIFFLSMYCQINSSMWEETFWVVFIKGASFLRGQMPPLHKRQIEFWHEKRVDGYEKRSMHEKSTVTYQILAPFAIIWTAS